MEPQPSLPPELFRPIIEQLRGDTTTLSSLARTSRTLHRDATCVLYRKVVATAEEMDIQYNFLRTITSSQALADLVHSWGIDLFYKPEQELCDLIQSGFACMRNLKCLWFSLDFSGSSLLLRDATFRLTSLRWSCEPDKAFLHNWIRHQHDLTELWLDFPWRADSSFTMDTRWLQNLRRIGGSPKALTCIVPYCHEITEVFWQPNHRDVPELDQKLSLSFKQLCRLAFQWSYSMTGLVDMAPYLTNLEVLEVSDYTSSETQPLASAISNMPKLRWVVFGLSHFYTSPHVELAQALFQSNQTLQYVSTATSVFAAGASVMRTFDHFQRETTTSHVCVDTQFGIFDSHWSFIEDGYLRDGWDGC
ncbi:hypothetical protein AX16_010528 [Volvariella volvacea WC 439]|nr:hypothetical protein AX16_010528 [Volvariella volvacea WC 439]